MASPLDAMLRGLAEMVAPMVATLLAAPNPNHQTGGRLTPAELCQAYPSPAVDHAQLVAPTPANHWPRCSAHDDAIHPDLRSMEVHRCAYIAFHPGVHMTTDGYRWPLG